MSSAEIKDLSGESPSAWNGLIERVIDYHPGADRVLLLRLWGFLGELPPPRVGEVHCEFPFRPLEVAGILADLHLDTASIAAGLLVEAVAANALTLDKVREAFGTDVAFLVEGITKIALLSSRAKTEFQAEDFRKMILAISKDIRVILVRLALCLQQLRGAVLQGIRPPQRLPREILEIYAPIAHRLGIYWVKNELEELAFQLSSPEAFEALRQQVIEHRKGGADVVRKVVGLLRKKLRKHSISGVVLGREKHIHSIHDKMLRKAITLEEMYDLIGYRIIVRKKQDCYRVLGMIHGEFRPIPGRFKDYIALPKSNGYQSLHTVVFGPFGNRIEIQIRSEKMHRIAESGVAAHWSYKGHGLMAKKRSGATGYAWLKRMLEIHQSAEDSGQFLENVKIDLFPDEIYLFTPAGDIITLPPGATPVDFAYAVHSEIGDHCQGAKVNGRMVSLKSTLNTGDAVEIITGKNQKPNPDWLQFVVTGQAKYRINRQEKQRRREQFIAMGRELLSRETQKLGPGFFLGDKEIQKAMMAFKCVDRESFLFQVGASRISPLQVMQRLYPQEAVGKGGRPPGKTRNGPEHADQSKGSGSLGLEGLLSDMVVTVARCCTPVPGDPIVGIVTTGKGISIHAVGCPNLSGLADEPDRFLEAVKWPPHPERNYVSRLRVMMRNRRETLTRVGQAVTNAKGGVIKIRIQDRSRDPCVLNLEVDVPDLVCLESVIAAIRALPESFHVERLRG